MNRKCDDESFESWLAEYDAALAEGLPPPGVEEDTDIPDFAGAKECLDLLEAVWPRAAANQMSARRFSDRAASASMASASTDDSIHAGDTRVDETSVHEPRELGRFHVIRELGRGGGGIVFLARDPRLNRQVALKVPRAEFLLTPELRRRFLRESEMAAQLSHPNIVPVYEAGEAAGICYLVSAYCPGPNLARWLREGASPVPPRQAALIVAVLADGVAHMHARGVLHRDIKPSNVLLEDAANAGRDEASLTGDLPFVPRLTDFGLAKMNAMDVGADDATRSGAILGTPAYMAPEQAEGRLDQVTAATDVYSLGVLLYELLTGAPPFRGASDVETLQLVVAKEVMRPRRLRKGVPRDLETVCLKCLEKAPARRYAAEALGEDLRRYLDGRPITARRVGSIERASKWIRRRPLATGVAALLMAAVGVIVALALREPLGAKMEPIDDAATRAQRAKTDALHWAARNVLYTPIIRKSSQHLEQSDFVTMGELLRGCFPEPGERDLRGFEWHYLWRLAKRAFALRGHYGPVDSVAFSSSGRWCATASKQDKKIIVWDLVLGRTFAEFASGPTVRLRFSRDDSRILAVAAETDDSSRLSIHDVAEKKLLREWSFPSTWGWTDFLADGRQYAGILDLPPPFSRRELLIGNMDNGNLRPLLQTVGVDLHRPRFSPDGTKLAVGHHAAGTLHAHLLDVSTGAKMAELDLGVDDYFTDICFSRDGRFIALGAYYGHATIWNLSTNGVIRFQEDFHILSLAFDPSGTMLYLGVDVPKRGYQVRVRDVTTGKVIRAEITARFPMASFALSPDGETIALGGRNGELHFQQLNPPPAALTLPAPTAGGEAWAVAFAPKEGTLAVGYDNEAGKDVQTLKLWDPVTKAVRVLAGHKGTVMAVAYSPDGRTLATGSHDKHIGLWNAADGQRLDWLVGHSKAVRAVAFSPDGRLLASGGADYAITLWDVGERKLIQSWAAHDRPIRALAFSPDGRQLASSSNDMSLAIWDVASQNKLFTLPHEHNVPCLAYAPDGAVLASGNENFAIKIWVPNTGKLKKVLNGHTGKLRALAFSPDGQTLATGGEDKLVRLWNVATWEEVLALPTEDYINGLAFDAAGKVLAAALHDGTTKIWSADSHVSKP